MNRELTLALPTGRIFEEATDLLRQAGWSVPQDEVKARKLHVSNGHHQSFILGKDRDVPTYVQYGVADGGIVGADVLAESHADVYQPLDLGIGRCRMVVAVSNDESRSNYRDLPLLRVATKYPRVASEFFGRRGVPVEVIPLAGSVELAPVLGLADCIVDLVQTGQTLSANGLVEEELVFESTARLILNRASYRLKRAALAELVAALSSAVNS
jgi:ATP phosphoribosyltransferase